MANQVLFLQTSNSSRYQFGLLNKHNTSIEINEIQEFEKTDNLFLHLDNLLKRRNLNFKQDIREMLVCAGPGSYTGMRVGEGISTIAEMVGIKILNYYHYEIPAALGHKQGLWMCKAFKGEYFVHEWSEDKTSSNYLVDQNDFDLLIEKSLKPLFYFGDSSVDDESLKKCSIMNNQIIHNNQILDVLYKNGERKQLMYFRTPENEFKVSK